MAYDEGLAQMLRDDLRDEPVTERKMFGGLAFLRLGHMVCGVHSGRAMFRVGKDGVAAALKVPGAIRMTLGGRTMGGMIACDADICADDARRGALMALAQAAVKTLPPK